MKRSDSNGSSIKYSNSVGDLGKIGFDLSKNLVITNASGADGTPNLLRISSSGVVTVYNNLNPSTNNSRTLGTSSLKWSNVYATEFTGALSGNADTATKLQTARTIGAAVDMTGSTSFDGSKNVTLELRRRGASVGQSTNTFTNPWYKVASCVCNTEYYDPRIIFLVSGTYSSYIRRVGILEAHFRSSVNKTWESGELRWILASDEVPLGNFVLAYKNGTDSVTVELWCKCDSGYNGYHFDVIGEGNRTSRGNRSWKLYDTWSAGSQASLPSGYTTIESTLFTLSNEAPSITKSPINRNKYIWMVSFFLRWI